MCGSGHSPPCWRTASFFTSLQRALHCAPPGCCSIQPSVLQKTDQIWPLFPQAVQCPAQCQQNVHHRSGANHTVFRSFSGNTSADFYSIPDRTLLKHVGEAACYCFDSSAPFSRLSFSFCNIVCCCKRSERYGKTQSQRGGKAPKTGRPLGGPVHHRTRPRDGQSDLP